MFSWHRTASQQDGAQVQVAHGPTFLGKSPSSYGSRQGREMSHHTFVSPEKMGCHPALTEVQDTPLRGSFAGTHTGHD